MRDKVRSYFVFTSFLYRIVMYAIAPVLLVGLGIWAGSAFGIMSESLLIAGVTIGVALSAVEILADAWLFGGIQKKTGTNLEYLKTSARGKKVLQAALRVELIRKFLTAAGILAVCSTVLAAGLGAEAGRVALSLVYITLMSYFFSVLGTFIARFWDMFWTNAIIGYVASILQSLCLLIPVWNRIWAVAVLAVLCILVSVAAVKMPLRRMEESYYDK